jgi:hypothetical protein
MNCKIRYTLLISSLVLFVGCGAKTTEKFLERQQKIVEKRIDDKNKQERASEIINKISAITDSSNAYSMKSKQTFLKLDHDYSVSRDSIKFLLEEDANKRVQFFKEAVKLRLELKAVVGKDDWKYFSQTFRVKE